MSKKVSKADDLQADDSANNSADDENEAINKDLSPKAAASEEGILESLDETDWLIVPLKAGVFNRVSSVINSEGLAEQVKRVSALRQTKFLRRRNNCYKEKRGDTVRVCKSNPLLPGNRTPFVKTGTMTYCCHSTLEKQTKRKNYLDKNHDYYSLK